MFPILSHRAADGGKQTKDGRDENGSTSTEVVIARIAEPATHERRPDVWTGINNADDQIILPAVWVAVLVPMTDTKLLGK